MLLEPGDNWPYVRLLVDPWPGLTGAAPTSVLLQMAVDDDTVPNSSTYDFATLIGAPLVTPSPVAPGLPTMAAPVAPVAPPTLGLFAYAGVEHEFLLLPGTDPAPSFAAQDQAAAFAWTAIDGAFPSAVIIDPLDPAQVAAYHP